MRKKTIKFGTSTCLAAILEISCLSRAAAQSDQRLFSVSDAVAWTRVVNLKGDYSPNPVEGTALSSPDGSKFVYLLRRGDLSRSGNVETIQMLSRHSVQQVLENSTPGDRPEPSTVFEQVSKNDWTSLGNLRWIDNARIAFLGAGENGRRQLFIVRVDTRSVRQITHSDTDVTSFDVRGETAIYYAGARPSAEKIVVNSYEANLLAALIAPDPADAPVEMYTLDLANGVQRKMHAPPSMIYNQSLWLSPSGRYAIAIMPALNAPGGWAGYQIPFYDLFGFTPDRLLKDPASLSAATRTRYALIDVRTLSETPLLDAPTGFNERSVIVSNTYLPLNNSSRDLIAAKRPAVAEIDIGSGLADPIFWEPSVTDEERAKGVRQEWRVLALDWFPRTDRLTLSTRDRARAVVAHTFEKSGERWIEGESPSHEAGSGIAIRLRQSLNEAPGIFASGGACKCERLLVDLNPQRTKIRLDPFVPIEWIDRNDTTWKGGYILPPNFIAGKRYPLIVQTHGFSADEFIVDGPGGMTGTSARAYAAAGFVVLQIADNAKAFTVDQHEFAQYAEGYRAGIEAMVKHDVVDEKRVGIIAFSRTGGSVLHLIVDYPGSVAAAAFEDASHTQDYLLSLLLVNSDSDAARESAVVNGPGPDPNNIEKWFSGQPEYKLNRTNTAIRIESIGPYSLAANWELFTLLKNSSRNVEMSYYKYGNHVLDKPEERFASQTQNLEWFRRWLTENGK
jgi:dipeptidyl aminopeptidase/acylaminoacyl peptidase